MKVRITIEKKLGLAWPKFSGLIVIKNADETDDMAIFSQPLTRASFDLLLRQIEITEIDMLMIRDSNGMGAWLKYEAVFEREQKTIRP
jgi:hypothetical protein